MQKKLHNSEDRGNRLSQRQTCENETKLKLLITNLTQASFIRPKKGHFHKVEQEDLCIFETNLVYMVNH